MLNANMFWNLKSQKSVNQDKGYFIFMNIQAYIPRKFIKKYKLLNIKKLITIRKYNFIDIACVLQHYEVT